MSQFCRHNRFISECPICSKGTVLDSARPAERRPRASSSRGSGTTKAGPVVARQTRGPYVSAGPYGSREVRLEKVPGGLRLASWLGGQMERSAPVLAAADLPALAAAAVEKEIFRAADAEQLRAAFGDAEQAGGAAAGDVAIGAPADGASASFGRSPGRSGDFKEELRVEVFDDGLARVARWLMRPNRGWELQQAPVMLPPARFAQALADAAGRGVLTAEQPTA